ncbi:MAG: ribonucleotide reductase subunit alpha [Sulfurimicrobium sp.]|nr:ribonucleotide reductase subunit alpha [Sulfurimicrobium sp.]MDP1705922.1 ribonucleotide reductase subunit alpha [Sulfurimicrobium sp.]MDP2199661.1 ribonucleotide reductase subunit alpha [Sulfurimicrobium sp.]MDP3686880.1 ribonucleotide reductase subunit alpha [Sulfurimicrobium sp.]
MNISSYEDLLEAAKQQPDPQRFLFVFTQPELPEGYAEEQIRRFHEGRGGVLTPKMCTDKALDELGSFSDLVAESQQMGQDWKIVFVACLGGRAGVMPTSEEAQEPLKKMVDSIQNGAISNYLAYDRDGNQVQFS